MLKHCTFAGGIVVLFLVTWFPAPVCTALAQDEVADLVIGLLKDPDKDIRALAFEQIRNEARGAEATRKFAALLPTLTADARIGLLSALADRGDKAASAAVRQLLGDSQESAVVIAAVKALGKLGGPDDLPLLLLRLKSGSSQQERDAARRSLVELPGEEVSAAMAAKLSTADNTTAVALLETLAIRRARKSIPAILKCSIGDDAAVRAAAMKAAGEMAAAEHVAGMVGGVLKAARGKERDAAEKAVMRVCHRIEDADQQAVPLLAAMDKLPKADRSDLLPTVGRVGGPEARRVVEAALASADHSQGIRAICNWPTADIAFRLLELARTDPHPGHRRTALHALIRIAPLPDKRTDQRRLDILKTAMAMCVEDADRRLVLSRAKAVRAVETLRFVLPYVDHADFAEPACLAVVELAHHSGLREAHREEFHDALDHVLQVSKDPVVLDRANRYKKGQTWVRPGK